MKRFMHPALLCAAIAALSTSASAQPRRFELRPFVGAFIPTGDLADVFKTATTVGGQAAVELSRNFHVVATGDWTSSKNKLAIGADGTDIWRYDAGVEANLVRELQGGWLLRPFAGIGGGGRTYDYAAASVGRRSCTAGYGALGSEFQSGFVALRLEARDYVSCFESPVNGRKRTRNDVGISFGVAYHFH